MRLPFLPAVDNTTRPRGKASVWTRAKAICHRAIEEFPDDAASQVDRFKELCRRFAIDPYAPGGVDGRALYARVFDYILKQREHRRAAGAMTG